MREPWQRKSDGWWYLTIIDESGKRRHERLAKTKEAAFDEWHKRQATPQLDSSDVLVAALLDAFLVWSERNQPKSTFDWHYLYVRSFAKRCGKIKARDLKPFHITRWLERAEFKTG